MAVRLTFLLGFLFLGLGLDLYPKQENYPSTFLHPQNLFSTDSFIQEIYSIEAEEGEEVVSRITILSFPTLHFSFQHTTLFLDKVAFCYFRIQSHLINLPPPYDFQGVVSYETRARA